MEKCSIFHIWFLVPPFNFLLFLLAGLSRVELLRLKSLLMEPLRMGSRRVFLFLCSYRREKRKLMVLEV